MKIKCSDCISYVEDKEKAYCDNDYWDDTPIPKTKLYTPFLFECSDYENREQYIISQTLSPTSY